MNEKSLNDAFSELDYDESPEDIKRVIDVLEALKSSWNNKTDEDYQIMIWGKVLKQELSSQQQDE